MTNESKAYWIKNYENKDLANQNLDEHCFVGYQQGSRVCGQCAKGYVHEGLKCALCPPDLENRGIIITGIILGVIGTFIYIRITLAGANESAVKDEERDHTQRDDQSIANGVKSIGLTYIQMMTLLSTYPIAWPEIFTQIFKVGGAMSAFADSVVNIKCLYPELTDAMVFYYKGVGWAFMPIVVVGICELCWVLVACTPFFKVTHLVRNMKATAVALLYFVYPDLCTKTLSMFSCTDICGGNNKLGFLSADLDEPCFTGDHFVYIMCVALPMIALYVVGLPLMAFMTIERIGIKAHKQGKIMSEMKDDHFVFGLFYSMFKADTWWWELTIAGRKVALAMIGVFGVHLKEMQVHLTMALVVFIILLTAMIGPYGDEPGKPALHILELIALVFIWLTLWAGSVFNTYPNCMSEDPMQPGEIEWCVYLSLTVGVLDGMCFFVIAIAFVYLSASPKVQEKMYKCWRAVTFVLCCRCCCSNYVTNDALQKMREIFKQFDADGSGSIDESELIYAMRELNMNKTEFQVRTMFRSVDSDNSGELNFQEFMKMMKSAKNEVLMKAAKDARDAKAKKNLFVMKRVNSIPMMDQGKLVKHHHHHHHHHHFYGEDDILLETKTAKAPAQVTLTADKTVQRQSVANILSLMPERSNGNASVSIEMTAMGREKDGNEDREKEVATLDATNVDIYDILQGIDNVPVEADEDTISIGDSEPTTSDDEGDH
jgi:hypothetical protein